MSEWIDIKESPAPECTRVLISCSDDVCCGRLYLNTWQCDPIGSYAGDGCVFDVTHWMPLPEPPEGKE